MKKFINYTQSKDILNAQIIEIKSTQMLYVANTLNRVLAKDLVASENSPAFKTSAMDGYAIKHKDLINNKIKIIGNNPAGKMTTSTVTDGTCIKTFTGSLMPQGSDTLIPIENVTVENNFIVINEKVPFGFSVRKVGENYQNGETLIKKGTIIDFAHIGVMASLNIVQVEVITTPTVAIASTGSEILDVGDVQTNDSQIRSSNHLTLEAISKKYGADVLQLGVVKDDKVSITNLLKNGLLKADIVVTTGGVSVGDYDFVKDVVKDELDCEVLFQGVNIKPGQHILCAKKDDKYIVALPGFAYSSTVTFLLYVLPLIFKYKGSNEKLQIVDAIMDEDYSKKGFKTSFSACNIKLKNGNYYVDFKDKKSGTSAILTNMLGDVALLIQNENDKDLKKGDKVNVILL
ncbi:MAG: molybdopterin molybdotransferase MoeA [Campylobacterota bacterium]|nr:molybdopterin molybdotransferase MoeA [Campylobacterota bacterium]